MAGGRRQRRTVATTTFAWLLAGIVSAVAGCEIAVGNDVPDFECLQGAAVCPGNEVCDPSSHQCVAPCSMTGCNGGLECDPAQNICVAGDAGASDQTSTGEASARDGETSDTRVADEAPLDTASTETATGEGASPQDVSSEAAFGDAGSCRSLACACSSDTSCDSGICAGAATVTGALLAAAGAAFCTQPCCTSADCGAGTVCFATASGASGGSYCVSPAWLQRTTYLGTGAGGSTCSTGSECRSGLCDGSACADVCCSTDGAGDAMQCAGGTVCRFSTFPGAASFDTSYAGWCTKVASGPNAQNGATCNQNADCQSNLCEHSGSAGSCRNACRNTADCGGQGVSCMYALASGGTGPVAACSPGGGRSTEGSSCAVNSDCESQLCDATSMECTDVCFADSDCTKSGWRCRPEVVELMSGGADDSVLLCGG
jgi:hypothetical protein